MPHVVFGDLAESRQAVGMAGILIHSATMMGLILYLVRRWRMPMGSWTFVLTLQVLLSASSHEDWRLVPLGFVTGLTVDALLQRVDVFSSPRALRGFAFIVPAIFFAMYFATLMLTEGMWWPVSLWAGAIILAGIVGWLTSYLAVPQASSNTQI